MKKQSNPIGALFSASVLWFTATISGAQSLTWLGTLGTGDSSASGVSDDGTIIVGQADSKAVVWNRASNTVTQVYSGDSILADCDASGSRAVGFTGNYPSQSAMMWTAQAGFQWLPPAPSQFSWAADITPSGAYAVGKAAAPISGDKLPALWNLTQNPPSYATYAAGPGMYHGEAYGISDDGRTIVAFGHGSGWGYRGVVFHLASDGSIDWWFFLMPASGHYGCVPYDLSGDGTVAIGISGDPWGSSTYSPVMWCATNNWQPELLANLGGSRGSAASIRGDVLVGSCRTSGGQDRAVRWRLSTATSQVEDLNQTYSNLLSNGSILKSASALSANGRFIVGQGYNAATARNEAFLLDTAASPNVPLRFTEIAPLADGRFRLSVTGAPGANIEILVSTNLQAWGALTNLPNPSGSLQFTDAPAPQTVRFYRARYP